MPQELIFELERVHSISSRQSSGVAHVRIWPWGRTTAWKHIKQCMRQAQINGPSACPRGLRHSFGVGALQSGVPISLVKRWLGHARLTTTETYSQATGSEEIELAARHWSVIQM
jgi:integrase/recombinase XerD